MSDLNRRDFGLAIAAFAALATVAEAQSAGDPAMGVSTVFRFSQLPVKKSANGGESRAVMHGTLPTGEFVEVHETMLPPGQMPHPPHRHSHSEFILIREGSVQHWNNGKLELPAGPGDIIFNAHLVGHGLKNVGTTPARYFVVAVGVQKDEAPVPVT
jgi:quercetin dioxygenase-like cupin family protein